MVVALGYKQVDAIRILVPLYTVYIVILRSNFFLGKLIYFKSCYGLELLQIASHLKLMESKEAQTVSEVALDLFSKNSSGLGQRSEV